MLDFAHTKYESPKNTDFVGSILSEVLQDMEQFAKSLEQDKKITIYRVALRVESDNTYVGTIGYIKEKNSEQ